MAALRRKRLLVGKRSDPDVSISTLRLILGSDCLYCGQEMTFGDRIGTSASIDHLVAVSLGGTHTFDNAVLVCKSCNSRKHQKPLDEWRLEASRLGFDVDWITFVMMELASMEVSGLVLSAEPSVE